MKLEPLTVKKLLREGTPGRYSDGKGLALVIESKTAARWERRYQIMNGPTRHMGLGSAFALSLKEARDENAEVGVLIAKKIDPIEHRKAERLANKLAKERALTFGQCAEQFFKNHSIGWRSEKHRVQWRATVLGLTATGRPAVNDYCRELRQLPVKEIDTSMVRRTLEPVWFTKTETASRLRARIENVMDWAIADGHYSAENPATLSRISKLFPATNKIAKRSNFASVPYPEVPNVVAALRERQGNAARALEFAIYCAARTGEVLGMTWGEVDLKEKVWAIPPERTKTEVLHRVPLSEPAIELLNALPRESDRKGDFVFQSSIPGRPLSPESLLRVLRRLGERNATVHGFRGSFSTWAGEMSTASNHAIELSLAHAVGNPVERAYRKTDLLEQRRALMENWARHCTKPVITAGENVQPIRARS